jgi:hypothetical protein
MSAKPAFTSVHSRPAWASHTDEVMQSTATSTDSSVYDMKSIGRRIGLALAAVALGISTAMASAPAANAAAYPIGVYAPSKINASQAQGWANLSRDCSGTYGCSNYIKIEKRNWWGGADWVAGWWANNNGWNSITATLASGCADYRTTTDSYNDVAGGYGSGITVGPVGYTWNGTRILEYRTTWSSGWARLCR